MILDALLKAIENSESLRVRYFGGSSPGGERELMPLTVKDGNVRAICLASNTTKTFVIEKMEVVIDGTPSSLANTIRKPETIFASVDDFLNNQSLLFLSWGWTVQHEGESISLHRILKNGKLIKTPDVALQFEATTSDLIFDGEQIIETNHRERSRPWIVRAKKQNTKTFGDFGKAQLAFLEFAKLLAPNGVVQNA